MFFLCVADELSDIHSYIYNNFIADKKSELNGQEYPINQVRLIEKPIIFIIEKSLKAANRDYLIPGYHLYNQALENFQDNVNNILRQNNEQRENT